MTLAPIALFVYNRPDLTKRTVASLQNNYLAAESELFIYSDGPKHASHAVAVEQVRKFLDTITGFKKVTLIKSGRNIGVAANGIKGITEMINRYGKVIVLEDDLVLSPWFLQFMNDGLQKYEHTDEVISIHGYNVPIKYAEPVFFLRGANHWGWATWARGWKLFNQDGEYLLRELKRRKLLYDFDMDAHYPFTEMLQNQILGKLDSWAIRWRAAAFLHKKLSLYPTQSLVQNIGGDRNNRSSQKEEIIRIKLNERKIDIPDLPLTESRIARKLVGKHMYRVLSLKDKFRKLLRGFVK